MQSEDNRGIVEHKWVQSCLVSQVINLDLQQDWQAEFREQLEVNSMSNRLAMRRRGFLMQTKERRGVWDQELGAVTHQNSREQVRWGQRHNLWFLWRTNTVHTYTHKGDRCVKESPEATQDTIAHLSVYLSNPSLPSRHSKGKCLFWFRVTAELPWTLGLSNAHAILSGPTNSLACITCLWIPEGGRGTSVPPLTKRTLATFSDPANCHCTIHAIYNETLYPSPTIITGFIRVSMGLTMTSVGGEAAVELDKQLKELSGTLTKHGDDRGSLITPPPPSPTMFHLFQIPIKSTKARGQSMVPPSVTKDLSARYQRAMSLHLPSTCLAVALSIDSMRKYLQYWFLLPQNNIFYKET